MRPLLRLILLSALLLTAVVVALPEAAAIQELEGVCRAAGPCKPTDFGCWIDDLETARVLCRF